MVIVRQPLGPEPLSDVCSQPHTSRQDIHFLAAEGIVSSPHENSWTWMAKEQLSLLGREVPAMSGCPGGRDFFPAFEMPVLWPHAGCECCCSPGMWRALSTFSSNLSILRSSLRAGLCMADRRGGVLSAASKIDLPELIIPPSTDTYCVRALG